MKTKIFILGYLVLGCLVATAAQAMPQKAKLSTQFSDSKLKASLLAPGMVSKFSFQTSKSFGQGHYQGRELRRGGVSALSVVGDEIQLWFQYRGHVYTYRSTLARPGTGRVSRLSLARLRSLDCGNSEVGVSADSQVGGFAPLSLLGSPAISSADLSLPRILEISADSDSYFYQSHGSLSRAQIMAYLNIAEAIYRRDLNISFNLVRDHVFRPGSDPFTSSNASVLLGQFTNYGNAHTYLGQADVYQLISGRDFDGTTIGLSFVSQACRGFNLDYGIVQDVGVALTPLVIAHELGHSLGASHDPNNPPSLMSSVITSSEDTFSAFSKSEISNYLGQYGSCVNVAPTPDMQLFAKSQSLNEVSVTIIPRRDTDAGCSHWLYAANRAQALSKPIRNATRVLNIDGNGLPRRFTARGLPRMAVGRRIYLRLKSQCGTNYSYSRKKSFLVPGGGHATLATWLRQLTGRLR